VLVIESAVFTGNAIILCNVYQITVPYCCFLTAVYKYDVTRAIPAPIPIHYCSYTLSKLV